jgi:uncharacterized protein YqkB
MMPIVYPEVVRVEIIATQPIPADIRSIQHIQLSDTITLNEVTYIVKINLSSQPPITSRNLDIYVGSYKVTRYSSFLGGLYFKVFNPKFFQDHVGQKILFSVDGVSMHDSGHLLVTNNDVTSMVLPTQTLPTQEQILGQ